MVLGAVSEISIRDDQQEMMMIDVKKEMHGFQQGKWRLPVMLSGMPIIHPNISAKSPMIVVKRPIIIKEVQKQSHPPQIPGGGTTAKMT